MIRPPPTPTLFPYTTLFRSLRVDADLQQLRQGRPRSLRLPRRAGPAADDRPRQTWRFARSEEHTSELQSLRHLVCRLLLEKKKRQSPRTEAVSSRCDPW